MNNFKYEYKAEVEFPKKKKATPNFTIPTFETFFNSDELEDISRNCSTYAVWDFNVALGDSIKEKYESLYCKVIESVNVLIAKGAAGFFWIAASPEIASVFEVATAGFSPISSAEWRRQYKMGDVDLGIIPMGIPMVTYRGTVSAKFRLYADSAMQPNMLIMGCNDKLEDRSHYLKMTIANFIC